MRPEAFAVVIYDEDGETVDTINVVTDSAASVPEILEAAAAEARSTAKGT
jgi:DNA-binding IclR family transcriptional regulator